ncbi:MAG: ABC transporter substrate-binding protein [Actinomycetota bacterium]|nr:ABC transporter substrate-binding protein [Actinomycetota bacterium]MDH5312504.1 ABC transporter substrate-binding protein [Actinomycetota bacterium]
MSTRPFASRMLVLVAVLALVAAACDSGGETPTDEGSPGTSTGGTIIHGTTDTIVSLDPAGQYDFGSNQISQQVYNTLLEVPEGETTPQPALADCVTDDSMVYTCTLQDGLTFSDGSELTSEDVAFSFQRNIEIDDPAGACSLLASLAACGKWKDGVIETPDPQTVVFNLSAPDAVWPFILTTSAAFIVPSDVFPADELQADGEIVGSGRYTLAQYRAGEQVVLEANESFWGDPPLNDRVIVQYFDQSSALKLAIEQGDVDIAWRTLTPTDVSSLQGQEGLSVLTGPGGEIRYLVFNTSLEPGNELAVRKAAAMVLDRQAIVDNVYEGTVDPLWSMVPAGFAGHIDVFKDVYGETPDVQGAEQVLKDAGVSTPVPIEIWWTPTHYGDASADEYAEIQRSFEESGLFTVTLKSTEWDRYTEAAFTDQYPSYQLGWFPDYVDGDNYVASFYSSSSFLNDHFDSKEVDDLIATERASTDQAEREAAFERIQEIGAAEVPIIPVWQGTQLAIVRDGVEGVQATLDPTYIFRYWGITKAS